MTDALEEWELEEQKEKEQAEYNQKCDVLWRRGVMAGVMDSDYKDDLYESMASRGDLARAEEIVTRLESDASFARLENDFSQGKVRFSEYFKARSQRDG